MWQPIFIFYCMTSWSSDVFAALDSRPIRSIDDYTTTTTTTLASRSTNIFYTTNITLTPSEATGNGTLSPQVTKEKRKYRWLVYVSAVPTILIFIFCVLVIAIKNRYEEDIIPEDKDQPTDMLQLAKSAAKLEEKKRHQKIQSRQKTNQQIYDSMLAKFKADKNKKRSFVGRKSSQIRIEGMASRSPKSLARKHIIIGKLNQEDLAPDGNSSALGQLVQLRLPQMSIQRWIKYVTLTRKKVFHKTLTSKISTHTFIGSKLIEDMTDDEWENDDSKAHLQNILERSREDLSEARKILPDDVNEALLPEDLEEAFQNFGNWEESLI